MAGEKRLLCFKCKKELKPQKTDFSYLGHSFFADVPRCPGCGQVFLPEALVKGRICEVETQLEDK